MAWQARLLTGALLASTLLAAPALAQTVAAGEVPTPATVTLAVMTPVEFEFAEEVKSNQAAVDQYFAIRLIAPILVDGVEIVPAGTTGKGQVVHSAKAGWGGKAGELIVAARYIEYRGVRIPLRRFRMGEAGTGQNRVGEAAVASAVVPVAGFLISGGEKIIAAGTRANAIVSTDTELPAPAAPVQNQQSN
jgi:hypothetical protein